MYKYITGTYDPTLVSNKYNLVRPRAKSNLHKKYDISPNQQRAEIFVNVIRDTLKVWDDVIFSKL